jgi:hypothetical protein
MSGNESLLDVKPSDFLTHHMPHLVSALVTQFIYVVRTESAVPDIISKATGTFTKVLADMLGELKRRRCDPEDLAGLIKLCDSSKRAVVLRYADRTIPWHFDNLYAATHSYTFSFSELKSLIDADNPDATRRRIAAAITRIIKDYFDRDPNLYKPFR